jgi:hypothetical protein
MYKKTRATRIIEGPTMLTKASGGVVSVKKYLIIAYMRPIMLKMIAAKTRRVSNNNNDWYSQLLIIPSQTKK